MTETGPTSTVVILGISADIGRELALRYAASGWQVIGTYRNADHVAALRSIDGVSLLPCDLTDKESIDGFAAALGVLDQPWDLLISSVGTLEPIGAFFQLDFDDWERSVTVNCVAQLRLLHALYPLRNKERTVHISLFAGGGTNNPYTNYSAYCVSKIALIKMCELLDDETADINIFIIGPGYVDTKIHRQTLDAKSKAGANYPKTLDFMESPGTTFDDIYDHINWCMKQGRPITGGRNFSTVGDAWRDGGSKLAKELLSAPDRLKLRRSSG